MSDPRGLNPAGIPEEIRVDFQGAQFTRPSFLLPLREGPHVTVTGTSVGLTLPPAGADFAYVQVTAAPVFWTEHPGTTPASGVGQEAALGDDIYLYSRKQIDDFRAVRDGSVSATLKPAYYKRVTRGTE